MRFILAAALAIRRSPLLNWTAPLLNGTVTDPHGSRVPGAIVLVVQLPTGLQRQTQTSSQGTYALDGLPVGRYTVVFSKPGFAEMRVGQVDQGVGQTRDPRCTVAFDRCGRQRHRNRTPGAPGHRRRRCWRIHRAGAVAVSPTQWPQLVQLDRAHSRGHRHRSQRSTHHPFRRTWSGRQRFSVRRRGCIGHPQSGSKRIRAVSYPDRFHLRISGTVAKL